MVLLIRFLPTNSRWKVYHMIMFIADYQQCPNFIPHTIVSSNFKGATGMFSNHRFDAVFFDSTIFVSFFVLHLNIIFEVSDRSITTLIPLVDCRLSCSHGLISSLSQIFVFPNSNHQGKLDE